MTHPNPHNSAYHKALLSSFAMADARNAEGVRIVYPLGFITDAYGNVCECPDCLDHRSQGPYCPIDLTKVPYENSTI